MLALYRDTLTWNLMGPDSNKMLKPGLSGFKGLNILALWSVERNRLEVKVKEEKNMATPNKSSCCIVLLSAFGSREGKMLIQSIPNATKALPQRS